jgi:hypothetical protein
MGASTGAHDHVPSLREAELLVVFDAGTGLALARPLIRRRGARAGIRGKWCGRLSA